MPDITVSPSSVSVTVATATAASWDPSTSVDLYSDFVADFSPFSCCTGTTGNPGGSTYSFGVDTTPLSFGKVTLSLSGQNVSRIGVYAAQTDTANVDRARLITDGAYDFKCRCGITTAATLQRTMVGMFISHVGASSTIIIQDGAAFIARGDAGNWIAAMASDNVMSEVDTSYSTSALRTLRIATNSTGTEVRFYIDGNLVRTATPGWDTGTDRLAWGIEMRDKATGGSGTAALAILDFMRLQLTIAR